MLLIQTPTTTRRIYAITAIVVQDSKESEGTQEGEGGEKSESEMSLKAWT